MTNILQHTSILLIMLSSLVFCNDKVIHQNGTNTAITEQNEPQPVYRPDLFPQATVIPFYETSVHPLEMGILPDGAKLITALPHSEAEVPVYSAKNEVLIYDHNIDSWNVVDFQGHSAIPMDLDGDGIPEWIGNHTDWVPPALEIHRWDTENARFESTVIQWESLFPETSNDTPSNSSLFIEDGKHIIQIGRHDAYAFFTYYHGVLRLFHPEDTRDRVLEMQMARRH
ncbi:hypothetical protein [Paenibacillus sp. RC67]|uniref:hypothetical protein n=1 Tax=Paenibacillus sp. RC67 TaxID=3039392 RepID=UPI0024ACB6E9|nr:hypothetical protein [Paenibacillus sp. RC67]